MTRPPEVGAALHALLDALDHGGELTESVVRDGLVELIGGVGEATVRLLELLERGGTLAAALADPAVGALLDLCGLAPVAGVPVTIGPRPRPRCEMCGDDRRTEHGHVADLDERRLLCVCDACRILLDGQADGRFRAVADDDATRLVAAEETPPWWDELDIPVGLAFLLCRADGDQVAVLYPGPAGVVETARPLVALPAELRPAPDVEALVVLAEGGRLDAWRAPVSLAYVLSGRLRHEASLGDPMATARRLIGELA